MRKYSWIWVFLLTAMPFISVAASPDQGRAVLHVVLDAFAADDLAAVRGVVTDEFNADFTDEALRKVAMPLRARLAKGYTLDLLGALVQDGFPVHVWKLSFEGEEESVLIRVVVLDGKIAGLLITRPFV